MATKRQVERKLRELMTRLEASGRDVRSSLAGALPESRIIEITLSDLGISYWAELAAGTMESLNTGPAEDAEIRVRMASDDLVELVDGRRSLFSAYLAGRVKIEASFGDLLRLRKLA